MPLDPQARKFLDDLAALGAPPVHTLPPQVLRDALASRPLAGEPQAIHRWEDRRIPGPEGHPDGEVPVRIYWPSDERELPVLVYFHGGGWTIDSVATYDLTARGLANGAGCIVVSVDYRLAPENPAPAALDDAWSATRWTVGHASEIGGDPSRVAVGGDSGGGNLAAVVCLLAKQAGGPRLVHQLLIYPATDATMSTPSHEENGEGYLLDRNMIRWFYGNYLGGGMERTDWRISPLLAPDHSGLPSAQIITGEFDPLRDEGRMYADKLRAAGVPVRYANYDGQIHTFFRRVDLFDVGRQAFAEACEELRRVFAEAAAAE